MDNLHPRNDPATVDLRGKPFYWPQRKRLRLPGFDYATPGAYFLTLCIHGRRRILSRVIGSAVCLTEAGKIVLREWRRSGRLRGDLELDALIIMPDHVHAIVWIGSGQGSARATGRTTIPRFMQHFKSATARRINRYLGTPGSRVWERSYWERRVQDARALQAIRAYIRNNPVKWWLGPKKPRRQRP